MGGKLLLDRVIGFGIQILLLISFGFLSSHRLARGFFQTAVEAKFSEAHEVA
jgi:hypothetical protein